MTTSGPFDSANAYSQTFTLTNTSFIPLRELTLGIGFCEISTAKNDLRFTNNCTNEANLPRILLTDPSWRTPTLERDEPFSIALTDTLTTPTEKYREANPKTIASLKTISELKGADAVIQVFYRPWIIPCWSWLREWICVQRFRFVADEQPNGKVMWRSVPLDWKRLAAPQ